MNTRAGSAAPDYLVEFELNGRTVRGRAHQPVIEAARAEGVHIPHLCYQPGLQSVGNCRACVVEIAGERVLAPACCRTPVSIKSGASGRMKLVRVETG